MKSALETFTSMMGDAHQAAEDAVELAYDRGRHAERTAIINWLRAQDSADESWALQNSHWYADAIEEGRHKP